MKKLILTIGMLLSLCVSIVLAQENRETIRFSKGVPFTWDVSNPIQTMEGATAHLIITTESKIEAISFTLKWYLKNGNVISSTEKTVLHSGNASRTNDMPEVFSSSNVWYNLYILPSPRVDIAEILNVKFSGKFLTNSIWNNMGQNLALYK